MLFSIACFRTFCESRTILTLTVKHWSIILHQSLLLFSRFGCVFQRSNPRHGHCGIAKTEAGILEMMHLGLVRCSSQPDSIAKIKRTRCVAPTAKSWPSDWLRLGRASRGSAASCRSSDRSNRPGSDNIYSTVFHKSACSCFQCPVASSGLIIMTYVLGHLRE